MAVSDWNKVVITRRQVDDIVVVKFEGRMCLDNGGTALIRDEIRNLLGSLRRKIILDLQEVTYIDSSGIGQLVSEYTSTSNAGGYLKLLRPTKRIEDLFGKTRLYSIFEVFEDEELAIASFAN